MRDTPDEVDKKLRTMPTDPARVRRTDPGDPAKCPVWQLHQVYSSDALQKQVMEGCRSADIGCLDCKSHIIEAIQTELAPMQDRIKVYEESPELIRNIINEGNEKARDEARKTLDEVTHVMGLHYK